MTDPVVLDSDTLSELSRGHPRVQRHARSYLAEHGRLTITAVTVFERVRGYEVALRMGKAYEDHLATFRAFAATCRVLPLDGAAADLAGRIWAHLANRHRGAIADIFIAAIATSRGLGLVTRNRRDFSPIAKLPWVALEIEDWTR